MVSARFGVELMRSPSVSAAQLQTKASGTEELPGFGQAMLSDLRYLVFGPVIIGAGTKRSIYARQRDLYYRSHYSIPCTLNSFALF